MANKRAYLYVLDTLADWEVGFITAELNIGRYFKTGADSYSVKTVSSNGEPITTMGGLHIVPDHSLEEINLEDADLLLLPGADLWGEPRHDGVLKFAKQCLDAGIVVAAICGATAVCKYNC